jgi:hypothetical protein
MLWKLIGRCERSVGLLARLLERDPPYLRAFRTRPHGPRDRKPHALVLGDLTPGLPAIYTSTVTMTLVRVIRCDCGFEAFGEGDDDLVDGAQAHARDSHGIELSTEVVLALARRTPPDTAT